MAIYHGQTMHVHDDYKVQQEFERLGYTVADQQKIIAALTPDTPAFGDNSKGVDTQTKDKIKNAIWALTVEHNGKIIIKKVTQDENFIDTGKVNEKFGLGIIWDIENRDLEKELKTIDLARRANIKAYAYASKKQVLDWIRLILRPIQSLTGEVNWNPAYLEYTIHLVNDEDSPGVNKYYGTDAVGLKGYHALPASSGHAGYIEYVLDYTAVTPVITIGAIPADAVVQTCSIAVEQEFDLGRVEIGDDSLYNRLMKVTENNLEVLNKYHNYPDYKYSATTDIKLRFYDGTPTQGRLRIYIYYH